MREAPSLIIIPDLQDNGMNVSVYDPEGEGEASKLIENVNWKKLLMKLLKMLIAL